MGVQVLYKDYDKVTGELKLKEETFIDWKEDRGFTHFFDTTETYTSNNIVLSVPTSNVCWIKNNNATKRHKDMMVER